MGVGKCWNEINDPASFAYGELRRDIINVVIILIIGSAMLSRGQRYVVEENKLIKSSLAGWSFLW